MTVTAQAFSLISAMTPIGQNMQALALTIAGDVVCSQCVGANGDGTNYIKDASVTNAKIASSAVTSSKIGSSAVSASKIASNAVTSSKIADGTITAADIGTNSIGADELQGVTKLIFAQCAIVNDSGNGPEGSVVPLFCDTNVTGLTHQTS